MRKFRDKIFGGLGITWPKLVIFAVVMGIYTALMALFVPDGNSFYDIAVTPEWWVLPAILIIVNCKKPLEAALKTFVFFLISQPLVYLIQVPFSELGWGLFGYYRYWFIITLFTFPGAFVGWYIKKDKWYSGLILSVMTVLLVYTGYNYVLGFEETFPDHLISTIYCFGIIPIFIFGIFKDKVPRLITGAISLVTLIILAVTIVSTPFETYNSTFLTDNNITLESEDPVISSFTSESKGNVELIKHDDGYTVKLGGLRGKNYTFSIQDGEVEYNFEYHYDDESKSIVVNQK